MESVAPVLVEVVRQLLSSQTERSQTLVGELFEGSIGSCLISSCPARARSNMMLSAPFASMSSWPSDSRRTTTLILFRAEENSLTTSSSYTSGSFEYGVKMRSVWRSLPRR